MATHHQDLIPDFATLSKIDGFRSDEDLTDIALDQIGKIGKLMASASPKMRGRLNYEKCVCTKCWFFFSCKKWKQFELGPTQWHLLEGGYQTNDNPFDSTVYESLSDAEKSINQELNSKGVL